MVAIHVGLAQKQAFMQQGRAQKAMFLIVASGFMCNAWAEVKQRKKLCVFSGNCDML